MHVQAKLLEGHLADLSESLDRGAARAPSSDLDDVTRRGLESLGYLR